MNVYELAAAIKLDKSEYENGLREAETSGSSASNRIGSMFTSAASTVSKALATAAKVGAVAIGAATTAAGVLVKNAVSEYADYEQLVGGVETLYSGTQQTLEEFAEATGRTTDEALSDWQALTAGQRIVLNNSEQAYKTAGLSMNDYMETATSFAAALVSSLENNTTAAANMADMAITDMADNANKMGTNIESIQNAYNGFAKQNYTMLDNLKLGYGGTKEEMERLVEEASQMTDVMDELGITVDGTSLDFANIVNAIHVVQTNMGVTGTTAKEAAETISGSVAMAKASWTNLMTALAADDSDELDITEKAQIFADSVATAAENIIPRVELAIQGIGEMINTLLPVIVEEIPVIITDILPELVEAGITLITSLAQAFTDNGPMLWNEAKTLIDGAVQVLTEDLPTMITTGGEIVTSLIEGLNGALPNIISTATMIITNLMSGIISALPGIMTAGTQTIVTLIQGITNSLPQIIPKAAQIIQTLASGLSSAIPQLIPVALNAVITFVTEMLNNADKFISAALELITSLAEGLISALPTLIAKAPVLISNLITAILQNLPQIAQTAAKLVAELAGGLISALPSLVVAAIELGVAIPKAIADFVESMVDVGINLVSGLWQGIKNSWSSLVSNVKNLGSNLVSGIKGIFGINSPSKVFAQIGEYCTEGFEEGIDDLSSGAILDDVATQMENLDGMTATVNTTANTSANTAAGSSGIMEVLQGIKDLLGNMQIVLDTGELVGATAEKYNAVLGQFEVAAERGV